MVDFDALPGQPKLFVIDGAKRENVETMMAVADRFEKTGTVRAIVAQQAGSIVTLEGTMRFGAGDYIVSDDPPTHAWPVRKDIFERTYRQIANAVGLPLSGAVDLTGERDAMVWANEFERIFGGMPTPDRDTMLGWFANAIEAGVLAGQKGSDERVERLKRALTVASHSPHDQKGEPIEGFPVCSECGAIQTDLYQPDPATIRANPDNGPDFERVYDDSAAGWEDATGQPEPVEDVTGQADPLIEDVTGQPDVPPKRKGRGNRR